MNQATYTIYSEHLNGGTGDCREAANRLADHLRAQFPDVEIEVVHGVEGVSAGYHGDDEDLGIAMDNAAEAFDAWDGLRDPYRDCVRAMRDSLGGGTLVDDGATTWSLENLDDELTSTMTDGPADSYDYDWDGTGCYRVNDDGTWGMRMLRVVPR